MSTATNPFTGQSTATPAIPVPEFLRNAGFHLQETLMEASRGFTDEGRPGAVIAAFAVAVLFGIVHIAGPGHGKLFTIGYFGSRRARLREGLWLSALVNLLDSLSALLTVGVVYGILSISIRTAGASADRIMKMVAYGAVTLMGVLHLAGHLRSRGHRHGAGPEEGLAEFDAADGNDPAAALASGTAAPGDPIGEENSAAGDSRATGKKGLRPWMLALSVGLIPCPVSSAILAWGIVNRSLGFSIFLVAGVSVGGMIAMTAFSFALIGGKMGLTRILRKRNLDRALTIFETVSMIFLVAVGILLFLTAV